MVFSRPYPTILKLVTAIQLLNGISGRRETLEFKGFVVQTQCTADQIPTLNKGRNRIPARTNTPRNKGSGDGQCDVFSPKVYVGLFSRFWRSKPKPMSV
jgi:hypothetical protein